MEMATMKNRSFWTILAAAVATVTLTSAWAHPGHAETSPVGGGFLHPLFGFDHWVVLLGLGMLIGLGLLLRVRSALPFSLGIAVIHTLAHEALFPSYTMGAGFLTGMMICSAVMILLGLAIGSAQGLILKSRLVRLSGAAVALLALLFV